MTMQPPQQQSPFGGMPMGVNDSMEFLIDKIKHSKNNGDFFESMKS